MMLRWLDMEILRTRSATIKIGIDKTIEQILLKIIDIASENDYI